MEDGKAKAVDQAAFRTAGQMTARVKIEAAGKRKIIPVQEIAVETMTMDARRKKRNQTETIAEEAAAEKTAAEKTIGPGERQTTIPGKDVREKMDVILIGGF